jgi:hypothetical protein
MNNHRLAPGTALVLVALSATARQGMAEPGTGGDVLYVTAGVRACGKNLSPALGVRPAAWSDLLEKHEQEGTEGRERCRAIFSVSAPF